MIEIKIKGTTSFGKGQKHSPKEKFVLLQKLRQAAKRFQKALPSLTRSRNFDDLWRHAKTSGRPHLTVQKIKLILSFINTDLLAMAGLCDTEEIPKQCILGLLSSGLLSVEFPILQPQNRKQHPPPHPPRLWPTWDLKRIICFHYSPLKLFLPSSLMNFQSFIKKQKQKNKHKKGPDRGHG